MFKEFLFSFSSETTVEELQEGQKRLEEELKEGQEELKEDINDLKNKIERLLATED